MCASLGIDTLLPDMLQCHQPQLHWPLAPLSYDAYDLNAPAAAAAPNTMMDASTDHRGRNTAAFESDFNQSWKSGILRAVEDIESGVMDAMLYPPPMPAATSEEAPPDTPNQSATPSPSPFTWTAPVPFYAPLVHAQAPSQGMTHRRTLKSRSSKDSAIEPFFPPFAYSALRSTASQDSATTQNILQLPSYPTAPAAVDAQATTSSGHAALARLQCSSCLLAPPSPGLHLSSSYDQHVHTLTTPALTSFEATMHTSLSAPSTPPHRTTGFLDRLLALSTQPASLCPLGPVDLGLAAPPTRLPRLRSNGSGRSTSAWRPSPVTSAGSTSTATQMDSICTGQHGPCSCFACSQSEFMLNFTPEGRAGQTIFQPTFKAEQQPDLSLAPGCAGSKAKGIHTCRAELHQLFHLPIEAAREKVGISKNAFKKLLVKCGFQRWPQRQLVGLKSLKESTSKDKSLSSAQREARLLRIKLNICAIMDGTDCTMFKDLQKASHVYHNRLHQEKSSRRPKTTKTMS